MSGDTALRVRCPPRPPRYSPRFAKSHPRRESGRSPTLPRPTLPISMNPYPTNNKLIHGFIEIRECGLSCGCDFALRSESAGCSSAHSRRDSVLFRREPFRVVSQNQFKKEKHTVFSLQNEDKSADFFCMVLRTDAKGLPPKKDGVPAGNERVSSPRTQIAKQNRTRRRAPHP